MKTKIFILAIIVSCISSLNVTAQNRVLTNVNETKDGTVKEITLFDDQTSKPMQKKVYCYDSFGSRKSLSVFVWNRKEGWVERQKYTYKYTDDKLTLVSFTNKEKKSRKGSALTHNIIYTYDENGKLLTMKNIVVEDVIDNMLVLK